MFWKTKKVVGVQGLPITLSKREVFIRSSGAITIRFLAYKNGDEWIGLVSYEQFREEMDEIRKRQELILDHLKLKYVPETETKKPAKLVEKEDWHPFIGELSGCPIFATDPPSQKPKKKRGRPKKK